MKKLLLSFIIVALWTLSSFAQPNPSQNAGGGSVGGAPIGGSAPIGEGIALLMALAATYGSAKVFKARSNDSEK
ncbi:MAG: hypothetical protein HPY80_04610 [Bacteroidales bacterium]|jgi:hypothetical protein|nr:hypothetical protein [Bacteroidales bacterium]